MPCKPTLPSKTDPLKFWKSVSYSGLKVVNKEAAATGGTVLPLAEVEVTVVHTQPSSAGDIGLRQGFLIRSWSDLLHWYFISRLWYESKGCLQNKKVYILGLCPKVIDPLPSPPLFGTKKLGLFGLHLDPLPPLWIWDILVKKWV